MYISKLAIKNFRNFSDPPFAIELKPFTVILGENNVGKTNLLCAVSLLFGQDISVVQRRTLDIDDINYEAVAKWKADVLDSGIAAADVVLPEVVIEATLTDFNDSQHPVIGDWYSNTTLTEAKVSYRFAPRSSFDAEKWVTTQRAEVEKHIDQIVAANGSDVNLDSINRPALVDFPLGEYRPMLYGGGRSSNECEAYLLKMLRAELLDALRDAERELIAGGDQRLLYRVLRQRSDSRYMDVKRKLGDLKDAIDADPSLKEITGDVEKLLKQVSLVTPGEDHSIGLQFVSPEAAEILKQIGMTYGANPITVARNGLGRNNLLYVSLVLSQLAKAPDFSAGEDSFVSFRVVGIEEPEAHLHPHLQDHLARNIEEIRQQHPETLQLILTSHSTHIAARLQLANTAVLFRREGDGVLTAHYVLDGIDPVRDKDSVRFLSLYLDATKSRMFFARRLILVEGIAEQTLLPVFFEQSQNQSLESVGCTVINVNGVAFRNFLTVVKNGFFKKCVVLTDSDAGTKSENRADALRAEFKSCSAIDVQITTSSTFEKDLIEANKSGPQKALLLSALTMVKPKSGPAFETATGTADIDVARFFDEIAKYKAEFAFSVAAVVNDEKAKAAKAKRSPVTLSLPVYIKNCFAFIKG
jgi:putative ATP-dependent endonuclease of OLD family